MPHETPESPRKFTAPSGFADRRTEPINLSEVAGGNNLSEAELVRALGHKLVAELTPAQIAAINADDFKREYIRGGDLGPLMDDDGEAREELKTALLGGASEPEQNPTSQSRKDRRHNKRNKSGKRLAGGALLTLALSSGVAGLIGAGVAHEDKRAGHAIELTDNTITPDQAPDYFSKAHNTAEMAGKHDLNNFGPPSEAGFNAYNNAENGPVPADLMNEWQEMFDGNSHILASYMKALGIGTDKMPSLDALSNDGQFNKFDADLNKLGDDMQNNPKLHAQMENQVMEALKSGQIVGKGEYQTDQISFYSDERNKPQGAKEAHVSLWRWVHERGDAAKYLRVEVTLKDGTKAQFEVKPDCHLQITWVLPSPQYQLGTPVTSTVEVYTQPPESIPPSVEQPQPPVDQPPVDQPPVDQPPVDQPPVDQPPQPPTPPQPQPPTPKQDHFNLPGTDNGTNAGDPGTYKPRPQHTEPAGPPVHVEQTHPQPALRPGSNLPPDSSSSLPGSGSGINKTHTPGNSGVAPHGPTISVPKQQKPHTGDRGGPK